MQEALQKKVASYLHDHNVATLATGGGGDVWAAAVFYVNVGVNLYFLSSPTSRHTLNIAKSPRVAATIQEDYSDWRQIKGIQLEGAACEVTGDEAALAYRMYVKKFPVVSLVSKAPLAIASALAKSRWFKIVPQRLFFIDNALGLGHREELDLAQPDVL